MNGIEVLVFIVAWMVAGWIVLGAILNPAWLVCVARYVGREFVEFGKAFNDIARSFDELLRFLEHPSFVRRQPPAPKPSMRTWREVDLEENAWEYARGEIEWAEFNKNVDMILAGAHSYRCMYYHFGNCACGGPDGLETERLVINRSLFSLSKMDQISS